MNDKNKSYYECKRCFNKYTYKIDMRKHLKSKNLCNRIEESYIYNENEIENLSLTKMYEINKMNNEINNEDNIICNNCSKNFTSQKTLKYHQTYNCINKEEIQEQEQNQDQSQKQTQEQNQTQENINNNNDEAESNFSFTTTNNVNLNLNIKNSLDNYYNKKILIYILKNLNLTENLENVLENEMHRTNQLFNNNLLTNIDIKNIVKKSMEDLDLQLSTFIQELENS